MKNRYRPTTRLGLDRLEDRLAPAVVPMSSFDGLFLPRFPIEGQVRASQGASSGLSVSVTSPSDNGLFNANIAVTGALSVVNLGQMSLVVQTDGGSAIPVAVPLNGNTFSFNTNFALNGTADGQHTLLLTAFDQSGHTATTSLTLRLDTIAPTVTSLDLATASDTGTIGDQTTNLATVNLVGVTEPNAVVFVNTGAQTNADATGHFTISNVSLPLGSTTIDVVAADAAGNQSSQFSRTFTRVPAASAPTLAINALTTNNATPTITGTVSDSAASVSVTVNGQTLTATVSGTTWSALVGTALPSGTYTVNASATNAANLTGTTTLANGLIIDLTAPSIALGSTITSPTNATSIPLTINFSEAVTGFTAADLVPSNGTISNFTAVSGSSYTATLTPTAAGAVTVNVAAGAANDSAGNASTSGSYSITFDNVTPTATITSTASNPTNLASIPITLTFSEAMSDLSSSGVTSSSGAITGLATTNGTIYTATLTGATAGAVTVTLAANAGHDLAGNGNQSATFSITVDQTAPTVAITSTTSSPTNASSVPITITFSEDVTGFTAQDIVVTNGTANGFTAVDGHTFTATVTPNANSVVSVGVAAGVAQDSAGNTNAAGSFSITSDTIAPSVTISSTTNGPTNATAIPITVTFTEDVTGFTAADIAVTGGTVSNFAAIDGRTYTAMITPAVDGTLTVNVAAAGAQDAAGNGNLAGTFSIAIDVTAPTAIIASTASDPTTLASIPITITFSEDVTGLTAADFGVTNGTLANFTSVDAHTYTATIVPIADGLTTVTLAANAAVDAAGNNSTAATFSITADVPPTVAIVSSLTGPTNSVNIPITITFNEDVIGFTLSDIGVTNGVAGNFVTVDAKTYTATLTPTADGTVGVSLAAGAATDLGGNASPAASFSILSDTTAPTAVVTTSAADPTNLAAIPFTVTFSEDVSGFSATGVSISGGAIENFTAVDGHTYTFTVAPSVDGLVAVDVNAGAAHDAAGNNNLIGSASLTSDRTAPTATITSSINGPTKLGSIPITIAFSENVSGLTDTDFAVSNGTLGTLVAVDGKTYTAIVTPTADGAVAVNLTANSAQDVAGNGNIAASFTIQADTTPPSVGITSSAGSATNQAFAITIAFSEDVSALAAGDVSVGNGVLSNFTAVDAKTYTATITPSVEGAVTVDVAAAVAQDAAGNDNLAGAFSIVYDITAPTAVITSTASDPTHLLAIPMTVTFDEPVFGFTATDVAIGNGTVSNFTAVSATTYTFDVVSSLDGLVTASISVGAAQDAAGNDSAAAAFSITVETPPVTTISSNIAGPTNAANIPITISFTKDVTNFDIADLNATNALVSNFVAVDARTYTATLTPSADGAVSVQIAAGAAQSLSGLDNVAGSFSIVSDTTGPTPAITITATNPTNLFLIPFTVTFNEDVTGFTVADIAATNGTVGDFVAVDGHTFTFTVIPSSNGLVSVDIAAGAAQDAAGNASATASAAVTSDTIAPSASITTTSSDPTNLAPISITISFSEDVTGFTAAGLTVVGGTLGNFTAVNAQTYTATLTPTGDGTVSVNLDGAAGQDAAGNGNIATSFSIVYDTTAPIPTITSTAGSSTNLASIPITIAFNEDVTGFTAGDVVVGNGVLSGFTAVDAKTYTALVAPTADGAVSISIAAAVAEDFAGNSSVAANFAIVSDRTAPTVSIVSSVSSPTNATTIPITITFSEDVPGFTASAITVANATLGSFTAVDGHTFTAILTPTADSVVSATVAADAAHDAAGNGNTAGAFTITSDLTKPTATITTTAAAPITAAFPITITFSEAVSGFSTGSITVTNGTLSNFVAVDAQTYTATVTPTADGSVGVSIAAAAAVDSVGNTSVAAAASFAADLPPVVTIAAGNSPTNANPIPVTFTFDEDVTGFTAAGVTVTNGALGNFTTVDARTYTATVTPAADGLVTITVSAGAAHDSGSVPNALTAASVTSDTTGPTTSMTSTISNPTNQGSIPVTVSFSEDVTGLTVSDFSLTLATIASFTQVDGHTYTVVLTPFTSGQVTLTLPAGAAVDALGNPTQAGSFTIRLDGLSPFITISSTTASPTNSTSIPVKFQFSEAVVGFTASDVNVTNGTLSGFTQVDDSTFTATVTPTASGAVTVNVPQGSLTDLAGNINSAGTFSITYDAIQPTPTISTTASDPTTASSIPITVTFNESVTGFTAADVALTNGTLSNFTAVNATTYTFTVTPTASGLVTVNLAAAAAQDLAGNDSVAATFSITKTAAP